ncbi:MAG: MFS transporter [Actinomycetota bacterium]
MTRSRVVSTYLTLAGLYTLAASVIWSVNTLFLLDAGLTIGEVFVANALYSVGMVAFEIPTGVVADTLGRRVSYLASVAILAATTLLYLWAAQAGASVVVFGAVSIGMGLGFTFYSGALEAWLVDALAAAGDGVDAGLDGIFARGNQVSGAAMFAGTIAGGFLGQLDLAVPFLVRAALLAVLFFLAGSLMVERGFEPKALHLREIPTAMAEVARVGITNGWNHPGLRRLMIAAAIRSAFFGWAFYASQPYLLELLARDAVWVVGLVTAGMSLAMIVGNQLVATFSRACGRRSTMLIAGSAVGAVAGASIGLTDSFVVAVAGLLIVAGSMGVIMPVRQAYLHAVTSSDHRATVVSFDAMIASIGGVGGQVGLGRVSERSSFETGYLVGGAFTLLALPFLIAVRRIGGSADRLPVPPDEAGMGGSCPSGLPTEAGVSSQPVGALTGDDPADR